jgi:protein SCO1
VLHIAWLGWRSWCVVWAVMLLAACSPQPRFHSIDITGAAFGKDFRLSDAQGQTRQLADFRGKVLVVFFGYTQCPDVCPTTLSELVRIKQALGAAGQQVQGVFVTVDPQRDTPAVLQAYMQSFDPSFVALSPGVADPQALQRLRQDFNIFVQQVPGATPTSYTVDHTAGSYVYDTQGRLRLFARYGMPTEQLQQDIAQLLAQGGAGG